MHRSCYNPLYYAKDTAAQSFADNAGELLRKMDMQNIKMREDMQNIKRLQNQLNTKMS